MAQVEAQTGRTTVADAAQRPPVSRLCRLCGRVLALLILSVLGSQAPVARAQTPTALSPEEAVIALAPFQLAPAALPDGYRLAGTLVDTLSTLAYVAAQPDGDPAAAFALRRQQGFVVRTTQILVPAGFSSVPLANFTVNLMRDEASARAYSSGVTVPPRSADGVQVDRIEPEIAVGEVHAAWQVTLMPADQEAQVQFLIRWQRGRLAFSVVTGAPQGQERLAGATDLVLAVDGTEAGLPAPALGTATVAPPATEEQRLDALVALQSIAIAADEAPIGFGFAGRSILHPARFVLTSSDPQAALDRIDNRWKRVIGIVETFDTPQGGGGPRLSLNAAVDGDVAAASTDLHDMVTDVDGQNQVVEPPLRLGDDTVAYQSSTTTRDGNVFHGFSIGWRHGRTILTATMTAPAASISMDDLVEFARQIEATYHSSALGQGRFVGPG